MSRYKLSVSLASDVHHPVSLLLFEHFLPFQWLFGRGKKLKKHLETLQLS